MGTIKGKDSLNKAIKLCDTDALMGHIESGVDLEEEVCGESGDLSPLLYAILEGYTEAVETLIKAGANVNAIGSKGMTPLYLATSMKNIGLMQKLIDAGSDVNAIALDGNTPLYYAIAEGDVKVMRVLIEAGVDVNAVDCSGLTPLGLAKGKEDIERVLKDAGASR